jgi:hypothetical protein
MNNAAAHAGKNSSAENLDRAARPQVIPTKMPQRGFGVSSHRANENRPAGTRQAKAISVVAKPALPRNGGKVLKRSTARSATFSPNNERLHAQVMARLKTKKSRIPARAMDRLWK